MDERKRRILQAIIDDYVTMAEPVGSRTIARKYDLGISPATIRNEMSDLEMLGYLEQPHASSGRIPSAKGYRFYVDCLLTPHQLSDQEAVLIKRWYDTKARQIEEVFQETAKILSHITKNVSFVLAQQHQCMFRYLQFLPLDETRAIIVVVTDNGILDNKIIDIPAGASFDDLRNIAEMMNNRLKGITIDSIKGSMLNEIKHNLLDEVAFHEAALQAIKSSITPSKKDKVYCGGTSQLLEQPEFRDVDKVKALLSMLEEERLLVDILNINENNNLTITIGSENRFSGIKDCSMIQATYRIDGQVVGSVAVLGPTRMEYGKVISVLQFMQTHLGCVLKQYGL